MTSIYEAAGGMGGLRPHRRGGPRVRRAITDYVTWAATGPFQAWPDSADDVPGGLPMPHWDWDGPVT